MDAHTTVVGLVQRPKPGMVVKFLVKLLTQMHLPRDVFSFYKFSAGKRLHPHAHNHSHTHTHVHTGRDKAQTLGFKKNVSE